MSKITERILEKASRPGGASAADLTTGLFDAVMRPQARERMQELIDAKKLLMFTRAPVGGRGMNARQYFTDPNEGHKWVACTAPELRPQSYRKRQQKVAYKAVPLTVSDKRRREGVKLPPGPVKSKALAEAAPVIVPAGVRTKVLPSAPVYARHQLTEDAVVPSVVSSAECRPWVRALEGARS